MKKIVLYFSFLILLSSCWFGSERKYDWTILVYMAADNGLTEAGEMDINEMEAASFSSDIKVICQIDRNLHSTNPEAVRYEISKDDSPEVITSNIVKNMGEIDSGNWSSLASFAHWGFQKYPSERKAIIIWSHGFGWYRDDTGRYVCPDNESSSWIGIANGELRKALENIVGLDLLIFDACTMQTIEVAGEVLDYSKAVVGCEGDIFQKGFPYKELFSQWDSGDFAIQQIVNIFHESYLLGGSQYYEGLEAIPISGITAEGYLELVNTIKNFSNIAADSSYIIEIRESYEECKKFIDERDNIDFYQFLSLLKDKTKFSELENICDSVLSIIDKNVTISQSSSMSEIPFGRFSIWFPYNITILNNNLQDYENLNFSESNWHKFLIHFYE